MCEEGEASVAGKEPERLTNGEHRAEWDEMRRERRATKAHRNIKDFRVYFQYNENYSCFLERSF